MKSSVFAPLRALWGLAPLMLAVLPNVALAQSTPNLSDMFASFSSSSTALIKLVIVTAWLSGIAIGSLGLIRLKEYAESGGRVKLSTPIMLTFVGACLIAMPGTIDTATQTLSLGASTGSILSEGSTSSGMPGLSAGMAGVLLFVKLIGHIAFFRGFLILKRMGEGDQQAGLGRALTHILGGAAAINIQAAATVLANSVGMTNFGL